jgi:hypothetical protein
LEKRLAVVAKLKTLLGIKPIPGPNHYTYYVTLIPKCISQFNYDSKSTVKKSRGAECYKIEVLARIFK